MSFECIKVELKDQVAIVTIDRPAQLNALNKQTIQELNSALSQLKENTTVRVVVLTGAGEKAFVAGADIKEFAHFSQAEGAQLSQEGHEKLFDVVAHFSKPVIAAINGFALGGGLELALACHIRLASSNAKMGLPEVSLGVIPGYGGTQRLTQIVGKGHALEMMLTAKMIDAPTALQLRLVNKVVSPEELIDQAFLLAQSIAKNSANAISNVLKAVNTGTENAAALEEEVRLFGTCFGTADFQEGTSAFLEKRKPNFK